MTEEEAIKMLENVIIDNTEIRRNLSQYEIYESIKQLKKAGYITLTIWEEAEDDYQRWLSTPKDLVSDYYSMVDNLHDALTSAVERIKELEEKAKIDEKRCPMCGKIHSSNGAVCPACENDPRN